MDLAEWNSQLFSDVCARGRRGQRLYLYVDRDLLGKLANTSPQAAVDDFSRAFRASMGVEPFGRGAQEASAWRRRNFEGPPPLVAHLAMSVLAVTEQPIGGSHGVYACQNRLLGLPETPTPPPGYAVHVPLLWGVWNSWLQGPGAVYGLPTAKAHPHWSLQGWARSQGLIRFTDRLQLEEYFSAFTGETSFDGFLSWLRLHRFELWRRLQEKPALEILEDVFREEAARWLEQGPRVVSRPGRQGLLQFDPWTRSFSGAVPVDDELIGQTVDLGGGEQCVVEESDSLLTVIPPVADDALLRDGFEHELNDTVAKRFGGEAIYVMRDDPAANGLLQVRSLSRPESVKVLLRRSQLQRVSEILRGAGIEVNVGPAAWAGWIWINSIQLSPSQRSALECLRLTHVAAGVQPLAHLHGGLRLRASTYLVGGEPDLLTPSGMLKDVRLDGVLVRTTPLAYRLPLVDQFLGPGEHLLEFPGGRLSFRTLEYVHEVPKAGGILRSIEQRGSRYVIGVAERADDASMSLSGASLRPVKVPNTYVIRRSPSSEILFVTDSGEVAEIRPDTPLWLRSLSLEPAAIDVMAAIRATPSPVACLVVRNTYTGSTQAIAVPPDAPRMDGHAETHPRPEAFAALAVSVGSWSWVGVPDPRIRRIFSQAIQAHKAKGTRPAQPRTWSRRPEAAVRGDVAAGPVANNPFDDVLSWLSEREHGRASVQAFISTWEWACTRYGFASLAHQWRRALRVLEELGHIERDYETGQIGAAPAELVALPASSGLYVLTGSRPIRLVERINDPDDDDPVVGDAVSAWEVHVRTLLDAHGVPAGPAAIYIEWDPTRRESVEKGLQRLGVGLTGSVAEALLAMQPGIHQLDLAGMPLTMSPGREMWMRRRNPSGAFDWIAASSDTAAGLYCYQLRHRRVYAWRSEPAAPLVQVEFAVGEWLLQTATGKTSCLLADAGAARLLAVPANLPLPRLLARSLVLRSGLPPHTATARTDGTPYLVYDNVDARTIHHVAQLLAQDPVHTSITRKLA
ncbi:hypothetical protein CLV70_1065 [Pseudosporangium ferrugineum]|uniref:Uncharacterized protein n=1 Tax=Pseudosporangium ferrugineum TaxID=439699 RepID=A0A2T0S788_9ACTN|nr:hypothetical protein CLV70_1065 [Pseudosporangium ferrugineum]